MGDVARLKSVAAQLAARVREDDPEANLRWLRAELGTDPDAPISEVERLLFVYAAAMPDDKPWSALLAWTGEPEPTPSRRLSPSTSLEQHMRREALLNATTKPRRRAA